MPKYGRIYHEIAPGEFAPLGAEGEPVFVLRGQDVYAWQAVDDYAKRRGANGDVNGAKECGAVAVAMRAWPVKKKPD